MHDNLVNHLFYLAPGIIGAILMKFFFGNPIFSALIRLPGTFVHEICHLVAALLLNGKPLRFSIIPKREGNGSLTLGHVIVGNVRWYNGVFIGMAPLSIAAGLWIMLPEHWSLSQLSIRDGFYWLITALILPSSIPSRTDFKVAANSLLPLICLVFLICLATFFISNPLHS